MEAWIVKKYAKSLYEWLAGAFVKKRSIKEELEEHDRPWITVDKEFLRLKKIAMLESGTPCKT